MKYKKNFAPAEVQYAVEHETKNVRNANSNKAETLGKTEVLAFETTAGKDIAVEFNPETTDMWMNTDRIATLFGRGIRSIQKHLVSAIEEGEIDELNCVKKLRSSTYEGNRLVTREEKIESLKAQTGITYDNARPF